MQIIGNSEFSLYANSRSATPTEVDIFEVKVAIGFGEVHVNVMTQI